MFFPSFKCFTYWASPIPKENVPIKLSQRLLLFNSAIGSWYICRLWGCCGETLAVRETSPPFTPGQFLAAVLYFLLFPPSELCGSWLLPLAHYGAAFLAVSGTCHCCLYQLIPTSSRQRTPSLPPPSPPTHTFLGNLSILFYNQIIYLQPSIIISQKFLQECMTAIAWSQSQSS